MTIDRLWAQNGDEERPGLSTARIVGAALELAGEDGLEAVSMSKIARRLGAGTMSLYRHVSSKDELVALMVEAAVGEPSQPQDAGWRAGLERWAWDLLAVVRRNPWMFDAQLARRPLGPRRAAWLDRALAALAGTQLDEGEKVAVVGLLNGFVFSEAQWATQIAGARDEPSPFTAGLAQLVDADRFPALRRAIEARSFEDEPNPDADFAFGLERVLDGIERLVAEREARELRRAR